MTEPVVITEETILPGAPEFEESDAAFENLKQNPRFMVALHERQLEKLANIIEELAERLISLEAKVMEVEMAARFPGMDSPIPNLPHGPGSTIGS